MKNDDFEELAKDIFEQDSGYIKRREKAWDRVCKERRAPVRSRPFIWAIACLGTIALAAGAMTSIRRRAEGVNRPPAKEKNSVVEASPQSQSAHPFALEIVRTRDLPELYIEIDNSELHRLFPNGIMVAQGAVSRAIAF